jgi:hypothetical protein
MSLPALRLHGLAALAALCAGPSAGCTAIVLNDALDGPTPCAETTDCPAGEVCEDDACVPDDRDAAPPPPPNRVDAAGGTVPGPDGVLLEVPADALTEEIAIVITRETSTFVLDDITVHSRFYRVFPDVTLAAAATLRLPLDMQCNGCDVFRESAGAFVPLPDVPGDPAFASCATAELGLFVAGEEQP